MIDALFKRILSEAVLRDYFDSVTCACQGNVENETAFSERQTAAARNARDVFASEALIKHYLCRFEVSCA